MTSITWINRCGKFLLSLFPARSIFIHDVTLVLVSAYRTLDRLHGELREYLATKGIGTDLTDFLLFYLHKKEQGQYVKWLQKLESIVARQ